MHKYTHVESIYNVVRYVNATNEDLQCPEAYKVRTPVQFRGTVKLHGSCAGVVCNKEGLTALSRTRAISVRDDNIGFAAFVAGAAQSEGIRELEDELRKAHGIAASMELVLYGEWCGPGIQTGMAINKLPDKQFVLFGARVVGPEADAYVDVLKPLDDRYADARIHSIFDVSTWNLEIDFSSEASKQAAVEYADTLTLQVEQVCPWGARFGIEGLGEGIVWTPVAEHWGNTSLYFKTKGEKHRKVKSNRKRPHSDPEVLKDVAAFVEFAVTEGRLEQGLESLRERGIEVSYRATGDFLKWVGQDVKRECAAELEASGLVWKHVSRAVTTKAKAFFVHRVGER